MIIPTGTIPISPGTKRAFGSLLLTVLLLAVFSVAGSLLYALYGLYLLIAWALADLSEAAAGVIVALSVAFFAFWWGIWHTMRQDGLFEDSND